MFSQRTQWTNESNRLSQKLKEKRKRGEKIVDLTLSNPTQCGFTYLKPEILKPFSSGKNLQYEPNPRGLLETRQALCNYYLKKGIQVTPEQFILTSSTSEAYTFLFRLLANMGENFLSPEPSYPLFDYLAGLNDAELEKYPVIYDKQGWRLDLDYLETADLKNTRAAIVVNPNNPTGNYIHRMEKNTLSHICQSNDLAIISDEVFLDFPVEDSLLAAISMADSEQVLTFTLSGISKIFGLPQMKLSWILVNGPADLKNEAMRRLEIIADTYLSPNTPVQRALPEWFSSASKATEEILDRIRKNHLVLTEFFNSCAYATVLKVQGGWYAILRLLEDMTEDEDLALRLLEEENIYVHPGYFYDFKENGFLAISLLLPVLEFQESMKRLKSYFEKNA